MRISVITVTFNSAATLAHTLETVRDQDYADVEHVLIDGASGDETVNIIKNFPHVQNWISEKDRGLYDAINKGIARATGDVVGILNSDDFFPHNGVLSVIAAGFAEKKVDAIYGDIAFVKPVNLQKIVRLYSARKFHPKKFGYGFMPPHPSFYAKRQLFHEFGNYQTDYKIAADYELLMRFLFKYKISSAYISEILVYMRTGGVSNENILSRVTLNKEIIRACRENGVSTNMFILSLKYFRKVFEFIQPRLNNIGRK
jgi:glycosyltransferase involved in cell wall biosynthesis